jgi:EAL domain-containing protein (putative c-di-GMP-specific phosphodiesterase class I)
VRPGFPSAPIADFGRGHIRLGQLRELSFAELKLDRMFVTDCAVNRSHAAVCKAVVEAAHNSAARPWPSG